MNVWLYNYSNQLTQCLSYLKLIFVSPKYTFFHVMHAKLKINLTLFCLPVKPALKLAIIHDNSQRSFLQRNLGIAGKNDLIRSQTEHSSCVAGRTYIACTHGGFPLSTIIHYILIQLLHKKPFSYSTLSFSLLSHSGLGKKILWMECLLLFKYFMRKCHLHPQPPPPSPFSLLLHQGRGGQTHDMDDGMGHRQGEKEGTHWRFFQEF